MKVCHDVRNANVKLFNILQYYSKPSDIILVCDILNGFYKTLSTVECTMECDVLVGRQMCTIAVPNFVVIG